MRNAGYGIIGSLLYLISFAALPQKKIEDLAQRYNQGRRALREGEYKKAVRVFSALLSDYGNSEYGAEIRYSLAEVLILSGDFNRAKREFEYLLFKKGGPDYLKPEALYGYALTCIILSDFKSAERALKELSLSPIYKEDERINFAYGLLHYFQGDYQLAVARLDKVNILEGKYFCGKAKAFLGKPIEAISILKEVANAVPNTLLARYAEFFSGVALYINGDYEGARVVFARLFKDGPAALYDYILYFYGTSLLAVKEYEEAIFNLRPLIKHPNNYLAAQANYFLGVAYLGLGKYQEALNFFQKTRSNYPKTKVALLANLSLPYTLLLKEDTVATILTTEQLKNIFSEKELSGISDYFIATISFQLGKYDEVVSACERVLTKPADSRLKDKAASLLLTSLLNKNLLTPGNQGHPGGLRTTSPFHPEDLERGIAMVERYLKSRGEKVEEEIYLLLGESYYYLGRYAEAEFYYDLTKSPYGRLGKAYCLYSVSRWKEAIPLFENLYKSLPRDTLFTINALLGLAYSYFNTRDYEKALDIFEGLIEEFPQNSLAQELSHFYAGFCYYFMRYYGQAVEHWQKMLEKYPFSPRSAEAGFRAGDVYFKAKEYDQARGLFRFVVQRFSTSPFAAPSQALIAQSYYNEKNYRAAIQEYLKFLNLFPEDIQTPGVRKALEMTYYKAGEEDTSLLKEFLDKFPESEYTGELLLDQAKKLLAEKEYEKAIEKMQLVVVNFPKKEVAGDACLLIAQTYTDMKRWDEAKKSYEKFLHYFPNHSAREAAYFNLATTLFNLGEYQRAEDFFQVVIDSFPTGELKESAQRNIELCKKRLGKE